MPAAPVVYFSHGSSDDIRAIRLMENVYVQSPDISRSTQRYSAVGTHGGGRVLNTFVNSRHDLDTLLGDEGVRAPNIGNDIRGVLCLYILDHVDRKLFVLPDPLGGGLVFKHADSNGTAISSDLRRLISFLKSMNKGPRKSLSYIASVLATGSGGLRPASYEGVTTLDQFEFLEISSSGVARGEYRAKSSVLANGSLGSGNSIDAIRDEISSNISVAVNAGHETKTAHLTGGFDSRLVLAGIMAQGVEDQFRFFCSGSRELPDRAIAEQLSAELSLTMTEHPGGEATVGPERFEDLFLQPMQHSAGMLAGQIHGPMTAPSGGSLVLSGGYGERLRSVYNARTKAGLGASHESIAEMLWGKTAFPSDPSESLLAAETQSHLLREFGRILENGKRSGVREDAQLDYLFLTMRNRYYVGTVTRLWAPEVSRFDPLYTLSGPGLALNLDLETRGANIIGIDLMRMFCPKLVQYPFDTPRISEMYVNLKGQPPSASFSPNLKPSYDGRVATALHSNPSASFPRPTSEDILRAKRLQAPLNHIAGLERVRSECRAMLSGIGRDGLSETFNYKILMRLMTAELNNRVHIRTVYNIYACLLWYYDED